MGDGWRGGTPPARRSPRRRPPAPARESTRNVLALAEQQPGRGRAQGRGPPGPHRPAGDQPDRRGHAPISPATAAPVVTATIPVGNVPQGVAVNPVTNTVYVSNGLDGTVAVISGKTNTVTATIPVSGAPYGVADCQASHVPLHGGIRWPHDQQVPP